eukprot:172308_1
MLILLDMMGNSINSIMSVMSQKSSKTKSIYDESNMRLIILYWFRTAVQKRISIEDIIQLVFPYCKVLEILQWSTEFKSKLHLELSNNNQCVKYVGQQNDHRFIVADIEPVCSGIHCWRIKATIPDASHPWFVWGISDKRMFANESYMDMFGVAYDNQWFPNNRSNFNFKTNRGIDDHDLSGLKKTNIEVDILLNIDKSELCICAVGDRNKTEAKMWDLPVYKQGWVPHIVFYVNKSEAKIASIAVDWYGIKKDNIFKCK